MEIPMSARSAASSQPWLALVVLAFLISPTSPQPFNCQIPVPTLKDKMIGMPNYISRCFSAGVEFIPENGVGVRLRKGGSAI
jgi:hypothetical protein